MTSFKLSNATQTYEIAGTPYRVGKLTLGAALQIEQWLATLPTPLELLRDGGILKDISTDKADDILNRAAQDTLFWPPDAITSLTNPKFLTRADFGIAFISALLAAYNPHLSPQEISTIAKNATSVDVLKLQLIAFGADVEDPKGENQPATNPQPAPSSESTGQELSHG